MTTPATPFSAIARRAINQPITAAAGLPNAAYTDSAFFQQEREQLFARSWACVGFASDLPEIGDARPAQLAGLPLLLVRDKTHQLRVFHNVCSHRGYRLVDQPCSVRGALRCPYHSWTYGLDGELRGTPHIGGPGVHEAPGFEPRRHGLKPVRSALWLDLVFVNLDGKAPAFSDYIAPIENRWRPFWGDDGMALLTPGFGDSRTELDVNANWKLAVENYCEAYHLPWIHPGLNSYSRLEDHYSIIEQNMSGQGSYAYTLADVAGIKLPRLPRWPFDRLKTAEYISLYPNVLLGLQVDHAYAVVLEPLTCDRTREHLQIYYVTEDAGADSYASARRAVLDSWKAVFGEDVGAVEGMQQGRQSPAFQGGTFSPVMDQPTHHFHCWVANQLTTEDHHYGAPAAD